AKVDLIARMLAFTNPYNFPMTVSTSYVNSFGFTPNNSNPTNVNFDRTITGTPLSAADQLRNIANLLYDPPAPVFVATNKQGSNEFRSYLDLNRNGVFDPTGLQPVV